MTPNQLSHPLIEFSLVEISAAVLLKEQKILRQARAQEHGSGCFGFIVSASEGEDLEYESEIA